MQKKNRLEGAASAYLRAAQHQPVSWHEWGPEAFALARAEDKPILLAIGAIWCHWCHVMDRASYSDAETAALIHEDFVAIKVDAEERPEVDARYQAAVAAISGQAGWPLTVFLTPEGRPFSGGSFFAAEERVGRPGFRRVLHTLAAAFRQQRSDVDETATGVLEALGASESLTEKGVADEALADRITEAILQQVDVRNGGFGAQPKFPHAPCLQLLLATAARPGAQSAQAAHAVRVTLARMASGGIHDQLGGGFHRYSIDEAWVVPRFEKTARENAELLRLYARAFETFHEPYLAQVAEGTVQWMLAELSDAGRGGFYASLNAEAEPGDEGDFFTWTRREAEAALLPEEMAMVERRFSLQAVGDMQHNPAKNVLRVRASVREIASELGLSAEKAGQRLHAARAKLLAARSQRPRPFVDRTMYSGVNGLCVSAFLVAGRALDRPEVTVFALRSLDRLLEAAWRADEGLLHVVQYGEAPEATREVPASLEDYAFVGLAALDAWESTAEDRWLQAAKEITHFLIDRFYDGASGGFFDLAQRAATEPLGILDVPRKPIQDTASFSGNAAASLLLWRLHRVTGEPVLRERATATLEAFAGVVEHLGLFAAGYAEALREGLVSSR